MKTNELMIGNWVLKDMNYSEEDPMYTQPTYQPYQIMTGDDIELACETNCIGDDDVYLPIPLTPDILQRIGFKVEEEYDENYDDYEYYATLSCFDTRRCKVEIKYETSNKEISVFSFDRQNILQYRNVETQIRYVHELQNLFTIMQVEKEIEL